MDAARRFALAGAVCAATNSGVYVTRFSATGDPLDTLPKQLAAETNSRGALACKPGSCLASWSNAAGSRATRLGANLAVTDVTSLVLGAAGSTVIAATFDGDNWAVGVGSTIVRVDPATGAVTAPTTVSAPPTSIASDGTNTWVVWQSAGGQVQADRVTRQGALVAGGPLALTTAASVYGPSIAFSATTGFVAWDDNRVHPSADAYAMRINLELRGRRVHRGRQRRGRRHVRRRTYLLGNERMQEEAGPRVRDRRRLRDRFLHRRHLLRARVRRRVRDLRGAHRQV